MLIGQFSTVLTRILVICYDSEPLTKTFETFPGPKAIICGSKTCGIICVTADLSVAPDTRSPGLL